ncbi:MAG: tRNA (adenosine(37)-N6)-dimethylallyltransferase MiaA [Bacteroidales bacterium]
MPKFLIVLIGPTGVGKTELSLRLAERYEADIISSDSRQLYRDLPIGTAAATEEQLTRVKHHFVGLLGLEEYFSAARFEEEVIRFLEAYYQKKEVALMTGGSMMYVDAVCKGIDDMPSVDPAIRQQVVSLFETEGLDGLLMQLQDLDPEYYEIVDRKNPKRVMHGLEICLTTGKTFTSFRTNTIKERPFEIIKIGITREREELYQRINQRVDEMIAQGLVEEAKTVYEYRNLNSLNTVGYKEVFNYLSGEWTLEFAIDKIKQNTRIYSRKQMTWFRRDTGIQWFHPDQETEIMDYISQKISADLQ